MSVIRDELIRFIYESLTVGPDRAQHRDLGVALVDQILTKIQTNKFLVSSLSSTYKEYDRLNKHPKIEAAMDAIIREAMVLIIGSVIMED